MLALYALFACAPVAWPTQVGGAEEPSAIVADGAPRFALRAAKALTCADAGAGVVLSPIVFVEGGKILAIGAAGDVQPPAHWGADWPLIDLGDAWLTPGLIDLHSHVGGARNDINDMVLQTNSGLRVAPTVIPANSALSCPIAAGVTTILYIPGSGTNIGGQGVLMKLGHERYEEALVRDPGSLKIAQGDNPTRWAFGMRRGLMAWNLATVLQRGRAYANAWRDFEAGASPRPERALDLDIFRALYSGVTQVSTHTQYYHLVLTTITMLARDFGLPAYIDHGSFDSYRTAPLAQEFGVGVILGPREIYIPAPPRFDTDGRIEGTAWGWEQAGVTELGFNTDAPVVPQEDLPTQAAMGVCFGMSNDRGQGLRGVTIVPARTAGIAHRVGSLEVGKDADILVANGDPIDPRTTIFSVFVDGALRYDARRDGRRW
ncbi:MAG: amidohydrolase family protein [Planctomycetota bacterium]